MLSIDDTLVACLAGVLIGYGVGATHVREAYEEATAIAVAQQGAKDYEKLTRAVDAQDSVRADLSRARAERDRMRELLSRREATASRDDAGAGASGCQKLLAESIELLGDCRERYLSCAGRHDALVEVVR